MNTAASWIDYWNRRVRKLSIVDLKLIQVGSMAFILVAVKLFPEIMSLSIWSFAALMVVCAVRPAYVFWLADDPAGRRPSENKSAEAPPSPRAAAHSTGESRRKGEMNDLQQWLNLCNRRVKNFTFFDVKSLQLSGMFLGIALVKLVPATLQLNIWQLLALFLICVAKPALVFFLSEDSQPEQADTAS